MANASYPELLNLKANSPIFGELMLRDLLLPDLLGEETSSISYWAGRSLARKLPVAEADLPKLFTKLGFGDLKPESIKHTQRRYSLTGTVVETRLRHFDKPDFRLEAGFLAQSLQQTLGITVEGNAQVNRQLVTLITVADAKEEQPKADHLLTLEED